MLVERKACCHVAIYACLSRISGSHQGNQAKIHRLNGVADQEGMTVEVNWRDMSCCSAVLHNLSFQFYMDTEILDLVRIRKRRVTSELIV